MQSTMRTKLVFHVEQSVLQRIFKLFEELALATLVTTLSHHVGGVFVQIQINRLTEKQPPIKQY